MTLHHHPSPNFGERRGGAAIDLLVLHYTAMSSDKAAIERLCDPESEVSAHYLISSNGDVVQLVDDECRAWHAGAGSWGGQGDVNSRSIGIELSNDGVSPFAAPQMNALENLIGRLMAEHGVETQSIIGHSDMAPERKQDPGARFDWRRLALGGMSVWPSVLTPVNAVSQEQFASNLQTFGYPECNAETALAAFRLRFRPGVFGPLDGLDCAIIRDLAARFPVDPPDPSA